MLFALHLPEHSLSPAVAAATVVAVAVLGLVALRRRFGQGHAPAPMLFAAASALVFALQAVNFPLLAGTSGHVLGSALAAIALGPWYGALAVALVVVVQCLALGDGGLSALGANVLNMAVIGCGASWWAYRRMLRDRTDALNRMVAAAGAGWVGAVASSLACALELAASGTPAWPAVAESLVVHYALLGILEGATTVALLHQLWEPRNATGRLRWLPAAAVLVVLIALTPWSSELPDGLQAALAAGGK